MFSRPGQDLYGLDLQGANLTNTDLSLTILWGAKLNGADLTGANLNGTDPNNVDYSGATWIDGRVCAEGSVGALQPGSARPERACWLTTCVWVLI